MSRDLDPHDDRLPAGIIFSLKDGRVWASWSGSDDAICLGEVGEVAEMMKDFLHQLELGRRLNERGSAV